MTKWILALCLAAAPVQAQDTAQWYPFSLPCGPVEPLFQLLAEKEEYLLFTSVGTIFGGNGLAYNGAGLMFTNQETGSWSYVMRFTEELACVVSSGKDFMPFDGSIPTDDKL